MKPGRLLLLVAALSIGAAQPVYAQCTYSVSPTSVSVGSTGGSRTLSVITGVFCSWSASSQASWITITSGSGTGLGSIVFSVDPNPDSTPRTGTVTAMGFTITVTQSANSCSYMIAPTTLSVPSVDWITITGGGTGSAFGLITFTVAANPAGAVRTGTISIGTKTLIVTQAAGSGPPPPSVPSNLRIVR